LDLVKTELSLIIWVFCDLFYSSTFVDKFTSSSIWTEFLIFTMERLAFSWFIIVLFGRLVDLNFVLSMSELTFPSIWTVTFFTPGFAQFSLVLFRCFSLYVFHVFYLFLRNIVFFRLWGYSNFVRLFVLSTVIRITINL